MAYISALVANIVWQAVLKRLLDVRLLPWVLRAAKAKVIG